MTDYVIQKATAAKYGVVPSPENIFECRKAILKKLGGDETKVNDIYECDKAILPLVNGGGSNLQEKTTTITENGTTAITPDSGFDGMSKVNVTTDVPSVVTQEMTQAEYDALTTKDPNTIYLITD